MGHQPASAHDFRLRPAHFIVRAPKPEVVPRSRLDDDLETRRGKKERSKRGDTREERKKKRSGKGQEGRGRGRGKGAERNVSLLRRATSGFGALLSQ